MSSKITRFSGPEESPGFLMWQTTMSWQRVINSVLAPLDLTHVQFVLLACASWLSSGGSTINQAQLAAQARVDVKMASDVLRKLEAKNLIKRISDPIDTRAKLIEVTKTGNLKAKQLDRRHPPRRPGNAVSSCRRERGFRAWKPLD